MKNRHDDINYKTVLLEVAYVKEKVIPLQILPLVVKCQIFTYLRPWHTELRQPVSSLTIIPCQTIPRKLNDVHFMWFGQSHHAVLVRMEEFSHCWGVKFDHVLILTCLFAGLMFINIALGTIQQFTWAQRSTQAKLNAQKRSWQVKVAKMMLTTSPTECQSF